MLISQPHRSDPGLSFASAELSSEEFLKVARHRCTIFPHFRQIAGLAARGAINEATYARLADQQKSWTGGPDALSFSRNLVTGALAYPFPTPTTGEELSLYRAHLSKLPDRDLLEKGLAAFEARRDKMTSTILSSAGYQETLSRLENSLSPQEQTMILRRAYRKEEYALAQDLFHVALTGHTFMIDLCLRALRTG